MNAFLYRCRIFMRKRPSKSVYRVAYLIKQYKNPIDKLVLSIHDIKKKLYDGQNKKYMEEENDKHETITDSDLTQKTC